MIDEQSLLVALRLANVINPVKEHSPTLEFIECATRVTSFRYCFREDRPNTDYEPELLEEDDRSG